MHTKKSNKKLITKTSSIEIHASFCLRPKEVTLIKSTYTRRARTEFAH